MVLHKMSLFEYSKHYINKLYYSYSSGIHSGAIRRVENYLQRDVFWDICSLHGNEKQREKMFKSHGGTTSGPYTFVENSLGWQLENIDLDPELIVKNIKPIKSGYMPKRSDIADLYPTWDQSTKYMFDILEVVETGVWNKRLNNKNPGPISHARWQTCCCRNALLYCQTKNPKKDNPDLYFMMEYDLKVYGPQFFRIKLEPDVTMGAVHLHNSIKVASTFLKGIDWDQFKESVKSNR